MSKDGAGSSSNYGGSELYDAYEDDADATGSNHGDFHCHSVASIACRVPTRGSRAGGGSGSVASSVARASSARGHFPDFPPARHSFLDDASAGGLRPRGISPRPRPPTSLGPGGRSLMPSRHPAARVATDDAWAQESLVEDDEGPLIF